MASADSPGYDAALFAVPGRRPQHVQFGYQAVLDGHAVVRRLAREMPAASADLLEIAVTIYAVDQLVARPRERTLDDGSTWSRDLWLAIPVCDPGLWSAQAGRLTGMLAWLTDDRWELEFTQRPSGSGPLDTREAFLFETVPDQAVPVLFSGGMDSAAGLAAHLTRAGAVAVSIDTSAWMQHVQQRVIRDLNAVSPFHCVPLRYRVSRRGQKHAAETSQRSRGLLFLGAGIATAWTLRQDRLLVFENGIGAINLPYLRSQFGSQAARAVHPRTLRMAQDLAAAVSGRPFRIDAPGLALTKAQLVLRSPPRRPVPRWPRRFPATRGSRRGYPSMRRAERAPHAFCAARDCTRRGNSPWMRAPATGPPHQRARTGSTRCNGRWPGFAPALTTPTPGTACSWNIQSSWTRPRLPRRR